MVTILQKSGSSGGCTARGVCVITNFRVGDKRNNVHLSFLLTLGLQILHASVDEGSGTQTEQTWIFPGAIIYNNLRIILVRSVSEVLGGTVMLKRLIADSLFDDLCVGAKSNGRKSPDQDLL